MLGSPYPKIFFLIMIGIIFRPELSESPSLHQTFNYITKFDTEHYTFIFYMLSYVFFLPMLSLLNIIAFGARNYLFQAQFSGKIFKTIIMRYLQGLLLNLVFAVFYGVINFLLNKKIYFLIRLSDIGHNHSLLHLFNLNILTSFIYFSFIAVLYLQLRFLKVSIEKLTMNFLRSKTFLKQNILFLITLGLQFWAYMSVIMQLYVLFEIFFACSLNALNTALFII
jgi:hypothetical protein